MLRAKMQVIETELGSSSIEALVCSGLFCCILTGILGLTYFSWSHWMAKFQLYESLVCVAEIKQTAACEKQFTQKMAVLAPYLQVQEVNLRFINGSRTKTVSGAVKMQSKWEKVVPYFSRMDLKDEIQVKKYGEK
jgi:hypothetical protein